MWYSHDNVSCLRYFLSYERLKFYIRKKLVINRWNFFSILYFIHHFYFILHFSYLETKLNLDTQDIWIPRIQYTFLLYNFWILGPPYHFHILSYRFRQILHRSTSWIRSFSFNFPRILWIWFKPEFFTFYFK